MFFYRRHLVMRHAYLDDVTSGQPFLVIQTQDTERLDIALECPEVTHDAESRPPILPGSQQPSQVPYPCAVTHMSTSGVIPNGLAVTTSDTSHPPNVDCPRSQPTLGSGEGPTWHLSLNTGNKQQGGGDCPPGEQGTNVDENQSSVDITKYCIPQEKPISPDQGQTLWYGLLSFLIGLERISFRIRDKHLALLPKTGSNCLSNNGFTTQGRSDNTWHTSAGKRLHWKASVCIHNKLNHSSCANKWNCLLEHSLCLTGILNLAPGFFGNRINDIMNISSHVEKYCMRTRINVCVKCVSV